MRMARSMAAALLVVLIERVPSAAARASTPTLSTPGRPCRTDRRVAAGRSVAVMKEILRGPPTIDLELVGRLIGVDVLVVDHPLAQSRLTAMRDAESDSGAFRAALHELTTMLVYEAARSFAVERFPVATPVAPTQGIRLANPPLIVPVLRAGLGMADSALALLPESSMEIGRASCRERV